MEKSGAKWRLCAIVSECFSVQRSLILWVFSAFAVTHPLLRLACRCHTCLCSTTAEAKLKLSKKSPLSRAPENQAYSFTTQTGLWVWNGTGSLRLLLFWSQKFATATQSLVKKKWKSNTSTLSGWQLWLIANVCYSNNTHKGGHLPAPFCQRVGDPKNLKLSACQDAIVKYAKKNDSSIWHSVPEKSQKLDFFLFLLSFVHSHASKQMYVVVNSSLTFSIWLKLNKAVWMSYEYFHKLRLGLGLFYLLVST